MSGWLLAQADARRLPLADRCVQCVATSPPYFGLRDYGVVGQIGLEPTPEAFVAAMVAVFREIRRVLRDDGVVFLNLGDSYFGSSQTGGTNSKEGSAKRSGRMFSKREAARRAAACDTSDTTPEGCPGGGCLCESLCGVCRRAYQIGKSHSVHAPEPTRLPSPFGSTRERRESMLGHLPTSDLIHQTDRSEAATADLATTEGREPSPLLASHHPTQDGFSRPLLAARSQADAASACLLCGCSLAPDARASERTESEPTLLHSVLPDTRATCESKTGTTWTDGASGFRTAGKACDCSYPHYTKAYHRANLKPKDLIGIPWRVALALQADGWYLRSDVIWDKPNPMPESVTDRPTKAHEYVFLLTKSERYFYDAEAVKDPAIYSGKVVSLGPKSLSKGQAHGMRVVPSGNGAADSIVVAEGRNLRTVWRIATQPYKGAHFATFPEEIPRRCIQAGTSEAGCCSACGAPWIRVVESERIPSRPGHGSKVYVDPFGSPYEKHSGTVVGNRDPQRHVSIKTTRGWRPGCDCPVVNPVPCLVLDPFNGSGTTGAVAQQLGRRYVGVDLSRSYLGMAVDRIKGALRPRSRLDAAPAIVPLAGQLSLFAEDKAS